MRRVYVGKTIIGYIALDENGELVAYKLFEKNPGVVAKKLNEEIDKQFLEKLSNVEICMDNNAQRVIRSKIRKLSIKLGFFKDDIEFNEFVSSVSHILTAWRMKEFVTRDKLIIRAVSTLENLNKVLNMFFEQLREWYTLHYPECKLTGIELATAIIKYGRRENFPHYKGSVGIELNENDIIVLEEFAKILVGLYELKEKIGDYISTILHELMPNSSSLIEPLILAKLITKAGSIEKLAKLPSSTIQLLGAEKALFRHLRSKKSRPPKHGVLFECGYVRNAPIKKRGKIARVIAAKLSIASKIDYYSGRDESERLKQELKEEIEKILNE
jgi:nucleolar protein 56